jgi:hypothetical protein
MKKVALLLFVILMAATLAMAQGSAIGQAGNFVPTYDVLGAHLNGGRGCSACHAPHSGAAGNGWVVTTSGPANNGDEALWGTDVTAILNNTFTFDVGDGGVAIPWNKAGDFKNDPLFKNIATCLSCHDGNVSKGAMMAGISWEQAQGMLPVNSKGGGALYGNGNIPTLLGNDGGTPGDYANDHPVGPGACTPSTRHPGKFSGTGATICAGDLTDGAGGLAWGLIITAGGRGLSVSATPGSQYAAFLSNYGAPAVSNMQLPVGDGNIQDAFVTCTTCHDQHSMIAVQGTYGNVAGVFPTYFFIRGPYNAGAPYDKTHAPSTMQFCRQCHFPQANEAYGSYNIGTAF